jgi:hypothetical protein
MASAVFPSALQQDPRYYQLGQGGIRKLEIHAVSGVVITRSDSGKTQFNYSEVSGAGNAAAISTYTYHPQSECSFGNVATVWVTPMGCGVLFGERILAGSTQETEEEQVTVAPAFLLCRCRSAPSESD